MSRAALSQVVPVVQTTVLDAYIGGLAPSGRRGVTSLLNRSASILKRGTGADNYPWEQLNYAAVAKVRAALLDDGYAVSSVNMAVSALRGVAQTAFNLNCMDAETLARIRSVKRVSGDIQRKGRALDKQEIRALIQAAKQHPLSVRRSRDTAIVLILCGTGLRAGELVKLERWDYDNGILTVRQGKGRKYREIHVADAVDKAIRTGLAPIFPYTFYHLTYYWFAAADIPVANDTPVHYADAIRCNVRRPPRGSLPLLTRRVSA